MAVISILSSLVTANTENFEKGMDRGGKSASTFQDTLTKSGASTANSLAHISAAASGLSSLSGVSGRIGVFTGQLYLAVQAGTLFISVIGSLASAAAGVASKMAAVIAAPFKAVGSLISGAASALMSAGRFLGGLLTASLGKAMDFGKWLAAPLISAAGTALGYVGGMISSAFSASFAVASSIVGSVLTNTFSLVASAASSVIASVLGSLGNAVMGAAGGILDGLLAGTAADVGAATLGIALLIVGGIAVGIVGVTAVIAAPFLAAFAVVGLAAAGLGSVLLLALAPVVLVVGTLASAIGSVLAGALVAAGVAAAVLTGGFLAIVAGGAGVLALLSSIGSAGADSIKSISSLAKEIGFTATALSSLASTAGLDADSFAHSMIHMQRGIADASSGTSTALSKMGLSLQDLQRMNSEDQLQAIYGAFGNLTNQADRASVAMGLFGRSGIQMLESLDRGSAGLDAARERAARFGLVFSDAEASAVRGSLKSWGQWGQAMEGVSRRTAVMMAPVWNDLGNLGGAVGEKIVAAFSDPQIVGALHGVWSALKDIAVSAWEGIKDAATSAYEWITGGAVPTAASIKDGIVNALLTVEFGLRNIGLIATAVWQEIQLGALTAASGISEALNGIIDAWSGMLPGVASAMVDLAQSAVDSMNVLVGGLNALIAGVSQGIEDFVNRAIDALNTVRRLANPFATAYEHIHLAAPTIPLIDVQSQLHDLADLIEGFTLPNIPDAGISDMMDALRSSLDDGLSDIGDDFEAFMENRLAQLAQRAASDVAATVGAGAGNVEEKAITGHGAALQGSELEYSLLNANQKDYTQETAANTRDIREDMRALVGEIRSAPVVRAIQR